jgi:WD40 repeat protein
VVIVLLWISVSINKNITLKVTGSQDGYLKIYDMTGKLQEQIKAHDAAVKCLYYNQGNFF